MFSMNDRMDVVWDAESEQERIIAEYNERFRPQEFRQVFFPPASGEWKIDALFPEGFFESAKLVLTGVVKGTLREGIEGVAAVFLCRHYLELALKYTLFHSRWLEDETHNATDVKSVGRGHDVQKLWDALTAELNTKPAIVPKGLDLDFVGKFVKEFHANDPQNWRFRYPGKQLPVVHSSHETLGIDFDSLLFNLQHTYDVLSTLDDALVDRYGENKDWEEGARIIGEVTILSSNST
jgi:hypothetical protein